MGHVPKRLKVFVRGRVPKRRTSRRPATKFQTWIGLQLRVIPLANGTVQGAVATWRLREQLLPSPPGRYRSLYRTDLPIRQRYRVYGQAAAIGL
jgi:hypothetical protein